MSIICDNAECLGSYLLVGVCSDEDAAHYKRKPIMNLQERSEVISACKFVDEIVLCPPSIVTDEFLDTHSIELVVHGDDSNEDQLRHFYRSAMDRGIYKSVPYTLGLSTTDIIRRIQSRSDDELARRNFLC